MKFKKTRPALLVALSLQQLCSPVFAQNTTTQISEAISSKALPAIPIPESAVVAAALVPPPLLVQMVKAPPPPPTLPKIISGVAYIKMPKPEYPDQVDIPQTSGSPRLDEEARQTILRSQFKPHSEDGNAIVAYTSIPITFHLDS